MPETLLRTKLFVPPVRPNLVPRPRLIEKLNQGLQQNYKLTLICAPAGFGKTTLVSEWITGSEHPVAWLSLDEGDNDPIRFLTYFIAALNQVEGIGSALGKAALGMLQAPQQPLIEFVLTSLINDIIAIPKRIILTLDDYHLIDSSSVDNALTFLLGHLPPQLHLVIATRSDPNLPLARHRARGRLTELRVADLRFAPSEAAGFLNQVMGLNLSAEDIDALEGRTEGWIAGLHLAALSMRDKEDIAGFISEFAGDDRYIVDYLVDEVLAQRPIGTRDFLLQTSILDRMAGPLCDAVTGQGKGQEILERLDHANLFIVPLDNRRRWYRYHHLFADLLRQRLTEATNSHEINILHQRASQWYEENEFLIEAVEHALAAEDFDNVIRLIEIGSMEILMRSQQNLLLQWQGQLPRELVASHPRFCMTIAWSWLSMGHPDEAEACLQLLEGFLGTEMVELFSEGGRVEKIDPAIQVLLVEVAVMRIELAIERGDIVQVFELSQLVLPYLEDEEGSRLDDHLKNLRSVVFFVLGLAYKISGKLSEAGEALSEAAELGREVGNVYTVSGSVGRLASVQSLQGHLRQAVSTCQRGLKLVQEMMSERSPVSGWIHAELGNLLYEQNDLEGALHHLQEGIDQAKPWGFLDAFVPGYTGLARVCAVQSDWDGAFAALDELAAHGEGNHALVMPAVESLRALLWVAQGKVDTANRWVMNAGLDPEGEINFDRFTSLMILARVLLAQGAHDEGIDLLTRMLNTAELAGWFGRAIQTRVLLALALHTRGDDDESLIVLEQALISAEPEGYVRVFVNEGDPMKTLLRKVQIGGIAPGYVPKLLAAFETNHAQVEPLSIPSLVEPLSKREMEVLRLLKTELSGPEIADELMIALSTMRTHTKSIYSKLSVRNRREAVRKAEELNLR